MEIAVVGAGISGLSCAWQLGRSAQGSDASPPHITLYEANDYAGGHAHTVDVEVDGLRSPVDTGFLVFNHRTYPQLVGLFDALRVETVASEMTFSVRLGGAGTRAIEWAGHDLDTVFAQRRNLVDPRFLRMLADLIRFNRETSSMARTGRGALATWTLGEFLDQHRYSNAFRDWYLLPMAAAIWSCSTRQMHEFPLSSFVDFCANHGLLQVADRPQWYTVRGGARAYVDRIVAGLDDVRLETAALGVTRIRSGGKTRVAVRSSSGTALYDHVVLACHSDQSLALLDRADRDERQVLGAVRYQANDVVLHTDDSVLPHRRKTWAAWNYQCDIASAAPDDRAVCVHYLINRLQPLPFERALVVSLNPITVPEPGSVLGQFEYRHPVFDARAVNAQRKLPDVQGRGNVWFCGAWTGYGFHEDGLRSGLAVAGAIASRTSGATVQDGPEARLAA